MGDLPMQVLVVGMLATAYVLWFLLPLIPAFITFRYFDSAVTLSGPMAGLAVKASGAFAAYLLVWLLGYTQVDKLNNAIQGLQKQYWTIEAQVSLLDAEGRPLRADKLFENIVIETEPRQHYYRVSKHKGVSVRLFAEDGTLPMAIIKLDNFIDFPIDPNSYQKDHSKNVIKVGVIELRKDASTSRPESAASARYDSAVPDSTAAVEAIRW